ncbi:uncharacterized protein BP5553_02809 [Venustampulla echinocandica]|uniref:CENP-C homolog n=1 Tax=Venustampulla echinocandica TaxID=2656787 RepID=A0A370TSF9_9HELO|nr:uncharacterized protein BP5553_02809 [Venustampulla echinocandica]RDL38469.1 hypothetical protein BP5553_02809 [Venustampulla echinocandica]
MPPQASIPKRKPKENQYLKTGLTLPDTGIRDENGLEPMDDLFSSPEKPQARSRNGMNKVNNYSNGTISSEEDMDMVDSTMPEPQEILEKRASIRLPPRSKSPIKTFLQSPARRNPSFGPSSSPTRGSVVAPRSVSKLASVQRKLNFSNGIDDSNVHSATPKRRPGLAFAGSSTTKLTRETRLAPLREAVAPEDAEHQDYNYSAAMGGDDDVENSEGSFQMVDTEENGEPGTEDESSRETSEEVHEPAPKPTNSGKRNATEPATVEPPAKKAKRGRPRKSDQTVVEEEDEPPTKSDRRPLAEESKNSGRKPGRAKKNADVSEPKLAKNPVGDAQRIGKSTTSSKPKAPGRKPKLAPVAETDSPAVKRGPPLPRSNRGLMILRRETPAEGTGFQQTRSGRNSFKPLAFWKNERVEYSDDEADDNWSKSKFLLPRIKEVVRAEEAQQPATKRPKSKGKKPRVDVEEEEDEPAEPWEAEPGRVFGDIRVWNPEDPVGSQADEAEEEIALSSAAIITRDVKNGSFKFAKTLTLPFFGSGMVDLPPGASKKPKNSRKMQMVFFVYYGRVQVTVNGNVFRIGKGGMWQIPRGNFYSIENDYDAPARLFFAQGCEVIEQDPDISQQ